MNKQPVAAPLRQRFYVRVSGIVQGVGFRPFVYGLAQRFDLSGWVGNDNLGVFIEIEGFGQNLEAFLHELTASPPPLAHIENVQTTLIEAQGGEGFRIVESQQQNDAHTLVSPDLCICPDCLRELFDPTNRRYHYPFTNCTNCGPRFTIIQDLPYDRPLTTMSGFPMCPECLREYHDPSNRRFHAQPNACPVCGPSIWFEHTRASEIIRNDAALLAAKEALHQGQILAVKGLGGFHLVCEATNNEALTILRMRKGRAEKPFALMVNDLDMACRYAEVNENEARLLTSRERPIVLLRKRNDLNGYPNLSDLVAPNNGYIGIMLPYTPLHYLLVENAPLVMTSGNLSGDPIVRDNDEAVHRLSSLVDGFIMHNRPIEVRCDDSVIRVLDDRELPIRRSRGYAPFPVNLPMDVPSILAVGGELKATFCITRGHHAILSQHIGDMENLETLDAFKEAVEHMAKLFRVQPTVVACDMHPRYLSSQWAAAYATEQAIPLVKVQHHHAHIAAVMAEHQLLPDTSVLGFCFDGTGYGTDDKIWGGEVLLADYGQFQRLAHLKEMPLPGGDAAIKHPYRLALAYLWAAGIEWDARLACVAAATQEEQRILRRQLERSLNTVPTSSMGRLFDAVAALIGVREIATYEAQAAIELETIAGPAESSIDYHFDLRESESGISISPLSLLRAIVDDILRGVPKSIISARFHSAVARMVVELGIEICQRVGQRAIALSGGVFQNIRLLEETVQQLRIANFEVYQHRVVPPNDGGIALGQAIIAATTTHDKRFVETKRS